MKTSKPKFLILLQSYLLLSSFYCGYQVCGLEYDHDFTPECLANPLRPQYGGGIVANRSPFGGVKRESEDCNKFIVALNPNGSHYSVSQKFNLEKEKFYTISAWLQVSHGESNVAAVLKTSTGSHHAGWSIARSGCWSMFKGGLAVKYSAPAELYFESDDASANLWADSIAVQPFTQEEWKSHQHQSIEKIRKGKVKIRAVDGKGQPLANASISIKQVASAFPLGNVMSKNILTLPAYQNWFAARFKYTVFENEMKWYINEPFQGKEDYSLADEMLKFVKQHNIKARGHNIVWENVHWLPSWVTQLSPIQFAEATKRRIFSIMKRYKAQLIHWDVVNENLHFTFLEDKLGNKASTDFFKWAHWIDGVTIPFLNDFNTIEDETDRRSSPNRYLQKIKEIRSQGYTGPLGIGLQGHFNVPNLAYVRAALDTIATAKLPIWITELDVHVPTQPQQAEYLEQILREIQSHPAVEGIMLWGPWSPPLCYRMCLTDGNFNSLPTGAVVDKILHELSHQGLVGTTDSNGYFEASLFHGDYELKIDHPTPLANSSQAHNFKVSSSPVNTQKPRHVTVYA